MNAAPKNCPHCAEEISISAKICPHCRQWLTLRAWGHPVYLAVSMALVILSLGWVLIFTVEKSFYPRPFYDEVPKAIEVLESKMSFRKTDNGMRIYLVGILTNHSEYFWKDTQLECRFFNAEKEMIDVAHLRVPSTVQAQADSGFSVTYRPSHRTNDYSAYELKVITARTARSFF